MLNHAKNGLYASIDHKLKAETVTIMKNMVEVSFSPIMSNDCRASHDSNLIYRGGLCTMLELEEGPSS